MNIKLRTAPGTDWETIEISEGALLSDIATKTREQGKTPYRILLARVNGRDTELTEAACEGDFVELLDMRTQAANLVYQRSLTMIYLAAVRDVFEAKGLFGVKVEIDNSINKGFFTRPTLGENSDGEKICVDRLRISRETVSEIEARMREIIKQDIPIEKEQVSVEKGVEIWNSDGYAEKAELLEKVGTADNRAVFYVMNDYRNYFFGPMVPSTGYVGLFELMKYRNGILLRFPYYNKPEEMPEMVDQVMLYEAFEEEHDWLRLLGADNVSQMNKLFSEGKIKDTILLSEALHEKKIAEIATEIKNRGKRIILIAGPSSSGKTTFAKRLCIQLRVTGLKPLYLGTDDYFVEREDSPVDENGEKNYEDLDALDINLFSANMNALLAGEEVDIPEFDFLEGKKVFGRRITRIESDQPIVIEGIHALNGELTRQIDDSEKFRIYISPLTQLNIDSHNRVPTTEARMLRRMVRDYKYRNHSPEATIKEWPKVRAGEDKNIFPYATMADVVFNSTLAYETFLLKKYAEPLLNGIGPEQPEYSEAKRILELFRFFNEIDAEKYVPHNSILREFIGGSVFVE